MGGEFCVGWEEDLFGAGAGAGEAVGGRSAAGFFGEGSAKTSSTGVNPRCNM